MERQVIYRDRQELQAADLNNAQLFTDESFQHVITDAITAEKMFVGLNITSPAATEIEIAAGRLWDGPVGKVFRKDEAERISIFSYLPVTDEKWLTISVIGQEIETDIQPRDFEIDAETGQMEPRAVAMELRREVVTLVTPGMESPDPQKPEAPTNYTLVGYVLLNSSGVQDIELAENKKLMRLFDSHQTVLSNAAWITDAAPKIASLMTDMAALMSKLNSMASGDLLINLACDVAQIQERLSLPSAYQSYAADDFNFEDDSDALNPDYRARIEDGLRFPFAGQTEQQLALFNPYESAVFNKSGLVLPAYDLEKRLETKGDAGTLAINQFTYKTKSRKLGTRTTVRIIYGKGYTWRKSRNAYGYTRDNRIISQIFNDPNTPPTQPIGVVDRKTISERILNGDGHYVEFRKYTYISAYWYTVSTSHTISGCEIAQTYLSSQTGWLAEVGIWFGTVGPDGAVTLSVCGCTDAGEPDSDHAIAMCQIAAGDLKTGENRFEFPQPVLLEAGQRYAFVVSTGGNHSVRLVAGTEYTRGTLFKSIEDIFHPHHTNDLKMSLYFAKFRASRCSVELGPISLSEGISTLDLRVPWAEPPATSLTIEYQPDGSGSWVPIGPDTADGLTGLPAMCHLRAIFLGTQDLMPGLELPGSRLAAQRPDLDFVHISNLREISPASDDIDVVLLLDDYDSAHHSITVSLLDAGGTPLSAGTPALTEIDERTSRLVTNFALTSPISSYKIKIEGVTDNALRPFIVGQRMDVAK